MSAIEIRPMRPTDRAAFVELTSHRPGYDLARAEQRTDVIWHIAFDNPTPDGRPTYYVAVRGEQIVCHMGRMPTVFWIGGKRHTASFAHDLFSHPDLQSTGRGFFVTMKLYKTVEEACQSFCGLCWTNDINVKLQQSRKYDEMWTKPWVRILSVERIVDRLGLPWPLASLGRVIGDAALAGVDRGLARVLRSDVQLVTRFDDRFDRFAERVGPKLGIAPVKDQAYLRWRYYDWPHLRTTTFALARGGELRGYIVLREPEPHEESGRILDFVVDPEDREAGLALGTVALRHYRELGIPRVEIVASSPGLQRVLRPLLFVERGVPLPLFLLNANKYSDPAVLKRVEHWHHAFGDSEGGEVP